MKKFNAKLLLFGEYGLMYGAKALAIPFSRFSGNLEFFGGEPSEDIKNSQLEIDRFVSFFDHHELNKKMNFPIRLDEIKKDLSVGLYFNSDIPLQYGVGSSGALCAAIYDQYGHYHEDLDARDKRNILSVLKNDFAGMEAYFHGRSSGFDPLVSFIGRPVLLNGKVISLQKTDMQNSGFSVWLIDTGIRSSTAPLVNSFVAKMEDAGFEERFRNEFLSTNDLAIQSFLNGNTDELFQQLKLISKFQSIHFAEMIPANYRKFVNDALGKNTPVKLLGSGGGGFLLAFVRDGLQLPEKVKSLKVF